MFILCKSLGKAEKTKTCLHLLGILRVHQQARRKTRFLPAHYFSSS
uniref:Uncharacterized protein n=1 Tax=Strigamia maritima TaxID=126957 RepID=T1IS26_STRMM